YQLSNGRAARYQSATGKKAKWLAIAQLGGTAGRDSDVIYLAEPLDERLFENILAEQVNNTEVVFWDEQQNKLLAEQQQRIGKLVLSAKPATKITAEQKSVAIVTHIQKRGLSLLPWSDKANLWRERVNFLYQDDVQKTGKSEWPDLSDAALLSSLHNWLAPFLDKVSHINHLKQLDLYSILQGLLVWPQPQQLDELAPERYTVPTGSNVRIDYSQTPPALPVKMQEMFGCQKTPAINRNTALTVHLLSPAGRPLQITQDLAGFWQTSYKDVQKEMKGRYPKHRWPDDPANEQPSRRTTKPRK
ncbi:MAG: ATP-dependent helicase C-terminal domain-containing protein, partial [Pontibacterium sp.]